jgi:signal transduction histidine kinase
VVLLEDRPRDLPASLAAAVAVVTFAMAVIGANLAGLSEWQIGPMLAAAVAVALPALLCRYRPGAALLTLPVVDVLWPAITSGAWATSPRYWADYNYVTPAVQWWFVDVLPAQLLVAYAAGSALAAARTVGGLALAVPAQVFYMLVPLDGPVDAALVGALAWSALLAVAALLGARVAQRATHRAMMQDQAGRTLVLAERARIARELHDVAAHHMSMIAVRAASAPLRVPGVGAAAAAPRPARRWRRRAACSAPCARTRDRGPTPHRSRASATSRGWWTPRGARVPGWSSR